MDKYLYVKGIGGLGNRLQSLCVAIEYAQRNQRKIFVDWRDPIYSNDGINVFYKYFDLQGVDLVESDDEFLHSPVEEVYPPKWSGILTESVFDHYKQKPFHRLFPTDIWIPKGKPFLNTPLNQLGLRTKIALGIEKDFMPCGSYLPDQLPQKVVVFTDYEPIYSPTVMQQNILLKGELGKMVEDFILRNFPPKTVVGVHVRNTDRKPLGSFDRLFEAIHKKMLDHQKIFLASDDANIKGRFEEEFGTEAIISTAKFVPEIKNGRGVHHWSSLNQEENKAEQIFRESVIDMWLLGKVDYLFYQGNSSFSRIAWSMKGQEGGIDWNKL